jgi:hypothetical protein
VVEMAAKPFFDEIKDGADYDSSQVCGYSEEEIDKIEFLHKIKVAGDFRRFLLEMGRCDGGLIGDNIVLYNDYLNVRGHIDPQSVFFDNMQDDGNYDYLKSPFVVSIISETQYYFIQTRDGCDDTVYHYDENTGLVESTNQNFLEFMKSMVVEYGFEKDKIIRKGELLLF